MSICRRLIAIVFLWLVAACSPTAAWMPRCEIHVHRSNASFARGDAATFVDFVDDASRADVATALQRHYGLESLASLDADWKEVPPIQTLTFVGQVR